MRVYGIIGLPVNHSRSPAMHNAAFKACDIDARYVPFPVEEGRLGDAVRGLAALGVAGFNVTVPHKQSVMAHLDVVSEEARAIGAVNTVVLKAGQFHGVNTDASGLVRSLHEAGVACAGINATVLGAGGAARAAVAGLLVAGVSGVTVAARKQPQAESLVKALSPLAGRANLSVVPLSDLAQSCFPSTQLLVQGTSATMGNGPASHAFAASLPIDRLPPSAAVVDLVYAPRETSVLRAAAAHGLQVVDGLGMLLHQGAEAFEQWTGQSAPLDVMRSVLSDST